MSWLKNKHRKKLLNEADEEWKAVYYACKQMKKRLD
jgi:hypothetical protein